MGRFLLGAVLGRNQSFESFVASSGDAVPTGWQRGSNVASFYPVTSASAVHSSQTALHAVVGSTGEAPDVLRYVHGTAQDAHAVAFPEVTTHALRTTVWARITDPAHSGSLHWQISAAEGSVATAPIAYAATLLPYALETLHVQSGDLPYSALARASGPIPTAEGVVDDVLSTLDAVALFPDWAEERREQAWTSAHRTSGGRMWTRLWHRHASFRVPLRWLSDSHAALLNYWWESQHLLACTLDSSDPGTVHLCRIVNERQPVGRRMQPSRLHWQGDLLLSGASDGRLSF